MDYSNLLNVINNDIELKGEVFKNLSKILFSIFSADKLEKQLHQYAKFLVLQTISSSEKGYRDVFVDCLKQIEEFDYPLLEICKKTFSQEMEKRNTLAADIYLNMAEMDDWNTYSIKDLEMFFEKKSNSEIVRFVKKLSPLHLQLQTCSVLIFEGQRIARLSTIRYRSTY